MFSRARALAAAFAAAILPSVVVAQAVTPHGREAPTMIEAYQRARTLIAEAVEAHGGIEALRAANKMRVTQEGYEYHRTQGRRIGPPYDSTLRRADVMIDLPSNRIVNETTRGFPGGFWYTTRFVSDGDKHFNVAPRNHNYSVQQWPAARTQFGNLFALPQWYLLAAFDNEFPGARRYLGRVRMGKGGPAVDAIHFVIPPNGNIAIGLDPETHRLRGVLSVGTDVFDGDTEVYTEFVDWRTINGVLMPSSIVATRAGVVTSRMRVTSVAANYQVPDSLLAPPASYTVAPPFPPSQPEQSLAPGVWAMGSGSKSLVVEFNDHVVVVDAPSSGSSEVIQRTPTVAPGKPIRYVIPTHHHDDHFFGVRYHVANGSTIVTTPGNTDYLRRMMTAPMSSLMQVRNQAAPTPTYRMETISGDRRVFADGTRTLEIHRIDSPHADDMLIAWLPAEGILFHADLIEAPAGVAFRGANADATMHLAKFIREKGWNVRTFAGAHSTLTGPQEFEKLAALPLIPPK
jgi:glyoxylase-like metal-dependent hydrolase (beta-lactamase superfamily II)